ncbi:hypothetical protein, partial [Bacteroides cellulosilyticus]|uniref:hypothetical protein n=1 Tax=Bacteroides cellulosilyticus TaxID=246787 RepID=UPI003569AB55
LESILNKFEGKDTNLEIYSSGFYVDPLNSLPHFYTSLFIGLSGWKGIVRKMKDAILSVLSSRCK